jgi:hypothetical protein
VTVCAQGFGRGSWVSHREPAGLFQPPTFPVDFVVESGLVIVLAPSRADAVAAQQTHAGPQSPIALEDTKKSTLTKTPEEQGSAAGLQSDESRFGDDG